MTSTRLRRPVSPVMHGNEAASRRIARRLAWLMLGLGMLVQSLFLPLGHTIELTYASVLCMAAAAMLHAGSVGGWRLSGGLVVWIAGISLAVEAIGVATGVPFGTYAYTGALGPQLWGVSALVPIAWITLAYPAYLVAALVIRDSGSASRVLRVCVAAFALTAWDVFLDPQMVAEGLWGWAHPEPSLPGTPGIPLTNYAGWLLTALIIMIGVHVMHRWAVRAGHARTVGTAATTSRDAGPYVQYLWTYVTCVIANATFWERPSVALTGGIVMGVVAIPAAAVLVRRAIAARSER